MLNLDTSVRMSIALGALSLVAGFLGVLALQDIYHGEADVNLEWRMLQVFALVTLMFHVSAIVTLLKVARRGGAR